MPVLPRFRSRGAGVTPIYQTKFGNDGNCLQAALASVFDLALEAVPDFVNEHGAAWVEKLNDWLYSRGVFYFEARYSDLLRDFLQEGVGCGWHLIGGPSSRGLDHVVV